MNRFTIRQATADDLPALTELMREADEREYSEEDVRYILCDLDENDFVAWIAHSNGEPCGITMLQRHLLRWRNTDIQAGFWVNLYIRPAWRKSRLFPQIVLTMFRSAPSFGFDIIYAATRRAQVAEANLALGMTEVGRIPLYGRLLRPGRLIAKYRKLGSWSRPFALVADTLFSLGVRVSISQIATPEAVINIAWTDPRIEEIVRLRHQHSSHRIYVPWDTSGYRQRFFRGPDGAHYELLAAKDGSNVSSAVVWRMAVRGGTVNSAVLMDVISGAGRPTNQLRSVFAEIHRRALNRGAELVLALPGWGRDAEKELRALGYRQMPETYTLRFRRISDRAAGIPLDDLACWRYNYAENDAF